MNTYQPIVGVGVLLSALIALPTGGLPDQTRDSITWWPNAPLGGKVVLSPNLLGPEPIRIQIQNPAPQLPDSSPTASTNGGYWKGRLIYLPLVSAQPTSLPYLIFQGVGSMGKVGKQQSTKACYRLHGAGYFQAPQFSPDGQSLLIRYGDPPSDASGTSQIYLWDMTNEQISAVGTYELLTSQYQISPNSRYIAINQADFQKQSTWQRALSTSPDCWSRLFIRDIGVRGSRTAKGYPYKDQWLSHEAANRPQVWTSRNTLLFTMPTGNPVFTSKPFDPTKANPTRITAPAPRPCIAEVAPGNKPTKLIERGYDPIPSPSNRFIAFFGWATASPMNKEVTPGFYLFERSTKHRFLISQASEGQVLWSHDNRKLLLLQGGRIMQWNLSDVLASRPGTTKPGRLVATLKAFNEENNPQSLGVPLFQAKNISRDNRFLFVSSNAERGVGGAFPAHEYVLQAIDLENGEVTEVARLDDIQGRVLGWDWWDETAALP